MVGREYLEKLARDERDLCELIEGIKSLPEFDASKSEGQAKRVVGRFTLVALAGELATKYGLTGWQEGDATKAAALLFEAWKKTLSSNGNNEKQQILEAVSNFIQRHGDSRFSDATIESGKVVDRAGWWKDECDGRVYLFNSAGLREALKGFDFKRALDVLQDFGAIAAGSERSKPMRITGRQATIRLYRIHPQKLEEDNGN